MNVLAERRLLGLSGELNGLGPGVRLQNDLLGSAFSHVDHGLPLTLGVVDGGRALALRPAAQTLLALIAVLMLGVATC